MVYWDSAQKHQKGTNESEQNKTRSQSTNAPKKQKIVAANIYFCLLIKELISANGEKHRLYEENNNLDLRLKELSAEYTNRLQQYIHDIAVRLSA